jgi:hypothetical protein
VIPPHEGYTRSRVEPRPAARAGKRLLAAALADASQPLLLVMHLKALNFSPFSLLLSPCLSFSLSRSLSVCRDLIWVYQECIHCDIHWHRSVTVLLGHIVSTSRTPSATDMLRRGAVAASTCHTAASDACCNKDWHELHERSRRDILLAATARRYAAEAPGRSLLPQRQMKKKNQTSLRTSPAVPRMNTCERGACLRPE